MRHLLIVRVSLVLIVLLGLAAAWCAQIGDGTVITAQWSLRDLRAADLTPERQAQLVTGLERLLVVQARMFNAFLYGGIGLGVLAIILLYLIKPMRPAA